jgi:hypothetical protein
LARPDALLFTQGKLDGVVRQRVAEIKSRLAPKAVLTDELIVALTDALARVRALEEQLAALAPDPSSQETTP